MSAAYFYGIHSYRPTPFACWWELIYGCKVTIIFSIGQNRHYEDNEDSGCDNKGVATLSRYRISHMR